MGSRRELALLLAAVVAIVALSFAAGTGADGSLADPRPTTFSASDGGLLALFHTTEGVGVPVQRRLRPWVDGEPLAAALVLAAPSSEPTPFEIDALLAWLEGGGSLILVARPGDALLSRLGLAVRPARDEGGEVMAVARPHRWTEGVNGVDGFRRVFADTSSALEADGVALLVAGDGAPAAIVLRVGSGAVLAWSDVSPLVNARLRESGAATVFARAAAEFAAATAAVEFDEYHHGYGEGAGVVATTVRFLRETGPGRMALQWAVVGAGLLVLLGSRFGAPYPPAAARRRSPLEHAEALAQAYRRGGARNTARRLVLAGLARRLGRPVPSANREDEWIRSLAARLPSVREPAEALLHEWERGDDGELLALTHHADRCAALARRR
jgi:hypothetical protein